MDAPTPPPAPDPTATVRAQTQSNRDTAVSQYGLNATNQYNPYGSTEYSSNGTWPDGTPRFSATTSLSPAQQQLLESNQKTQQGLSDVGNQQIQRIGQTLNTPVSLPKLDLGGKLDLGNPLKLDTAATEARTMELQRQRLDPILAQRAEAKKAELFNAGVQPGTEAYRRGMLENSQAANDATNQLILSGHGQAVNDLTTQYNADQARRTGEYSADQTQRLTGYNADTSQTLQQRNQMFNEIASLLNGSQIQLPGQINTPTAGIAPTDIIGAQQQALNQGNVAFNAANQRNTGMMTGLFGLGGAALGNVRGPSMGGWGFGRASS